MTPRYDVLIPPLIERGVRQALLQARNTPPTSEDELVASIIYNCMTALDEAFVLNEASERFLIEQALQQQQNSAIGEGRGGHPAAEGEVLTPQV